MVWGATERKFLRSLALGSSLALAWISWDSSTTGSLPSPKLWIDPNTAPPEVFGALPGLGPALSARIVEARELSPFRSIDDLDRRVKGIGPAKVASIRPFLQFDANPESPR